MEQKHRPAEPSPSTESLSLGRLGCLRAEPRPGEPGGSAAQKVTLRSPRARLRRGRLRSLGRQRRRALQLPRKDMSGAAMAMRRLPPKLGPCVPRRARLLRCTVLGATSPQPCPSPHLSAEVGGEGALASPLLWAARRVRAADADCFPEPGLARSVRGPRGGGRPNPQGH